MTELWDPLWEYVLKDYDHVEESTRRRSRRSQGSSNISKNGSRGSKTLRSSDSRNDDQTDIKRENDSDTRGILNMGSWTLFDTSNNGGNIHDCTGDNLDNGGENQRQDASNAGWLDERELEQEAKRSRKKGTRHSDGRSSTGGHSPPNSEINLSRPRRENRTFSRRSLGSSIDEGDVDGGGVVKTSSGTPKYTELRSSMRKSSSESQRTLSLKQSRSESSSRSDVETEVERNNLVSESTSFGDMWDEHTGKSPPNISPERGLKSKPRKARERDTGGTSSSTRSKILSLQLMKSNSESTSTKGQTESKTTERKRTSFMRRNTKRVDNVAPPSRSVTFDENLVSVKEISLNGCSSGESAKEINKAEARLNPEFDLLMLLFEVAAKLDPWAVDSTVADSPYDNNESETTDLKDEDSDILDSNFVHSSHPKTENMEAFLEQPLSDPNMFDPRYAYHPYQSRTPELAYSTEIRLKVNTKGKKVSEQVFKRGPSISEEESEADIDNSQLWGTVDTPSVHSSVEHTPETKISLRDSQRSFSGSSKRSENSEDWGLHESFKSSDTAPFGPTNETLFEEGGILSEEFRVPRDLHIRTDEGELFLDHFEEQFSENEAKGLWKVVCCNVGKRNGKSYDRISHLRKEDVAAIFPATRLISNGQSRSIIGPKADLVNGIMGVPSGHFEESKGPQSLYAYDYESNEHMDVFYNNVNQKPRTSISVRTLGQPPSISQSALGESIVVQIEVRGRHESF
jgi:hypothetical protein